MKKRQINDSDETTLCNPLGRLDMDKLKGYFREKALEWRYIAHKDSFQEVYDDIYTYILNIYKCLKEAQDRSEYPIVSSAVQELLSGYKVGKWKEFLAKAFSRLPIEYSNNPLLLLTDLGIYRIYYGTQAEVREILFNEKFTVRPSSDPLLEEAVNIVIKRKGLDLKCKRYIGVNKNRIVYYLWNTPLSGIDWEIIWCVQTIYDNLRETTTVL